MSCNVTDLRLVQPSNAWAPILTFTELSGKITVSRFVHPAKTYSPKLYIYGGISTDVRLVHFSNAWALMAPSE